MSLMGTEVPCSLKWGASNLSQWILYENTITLQRDRKRRLPHHRSNRPPASFFALLKWVQTLNRSLQPSLCVKSVVFRCRLEENELWTRYADGRQIWAYSASPSSICTEKQTSEHRFSQGGSQRLLQRWTLSDYPKLSLIHWWKRFCLTQTHCDQSCVRSIHIWCRRINPGVWHSQKDVDHQVPPCVDPWPQWSPPVSLHYWTQGSAGHWGRGRALLLNVSKVLLVVTNGEGYQRILSAVTALSCQWPDSDSAHIRRTSSWREEERSPSISTSVSWFWRMILWLCEIDPEYKSWSFHSRRWPHGLVQTIWSS